MTSDPHALRSEADLEAIYGEVVPAAKIKELPVIIDEIRQFIDASPFLILATAGPEGLDCSPRGDPAGQLVRIVDDRTIQIPDRRGNNRIDSLRNIVRDPRVALLFLIPGVGETLRLNGTARLTADPALCASFAMGDKVPRCVIEIRIDTVFTQCQKALVRSKLWDPATQIERSELPTVGEIMTAITAGEFDGAAYDAAYPERLRQTIY
ncbi:pyridoxamine 5'-phosphate oxidase family protein [Aquihabitans sp. McL0605]|uniref:pyridoxamine 5'-phosphate oxidase family protein n=1 Tax=Aquihabitans sp. McL0605 TaxID=3415671 RepID=UPI003CF2B45B